MQTTNTNTEKAPVKAGNRVNIATDRNTYEHFINSQSALIALRDSMGVRTDWHEPDEQEVSVSIVSTKYVGNSTYNLTETKVRNFDNAYGDKTEAHIVIYKNGCVAGKLNLAYLLSLACGNDYRK
jgi:hypothetical protein